jgi:hypothetical protein
MQFYRARVGSIHHQVSANAPPTCDVLTDGPQNEDRDVDAMRDLYQARRSAVDSWDGRLRLPGLRAVNLQIAADWKFEPSKKRRDAVRSAQNWAQKRRRMLPDAMYHERASKQAEAGMEATK